MAIENQADLERVAQLIEELKVAAGLVPAPDQPEASGDAAPPAEAEDTAKFATPALASSTPASVPTIEPVDEADVPDAVKAQDQGA